MKTTLKILSIIINLWLLIFGIFIIFDLADIFGYESFIVLGKGELLLSLTMIFSAILSLFYILVKIGPDTIKGYFGTFFERKVLEEKLKKQKINKMLDRLNKEK